MTFPYATIAKEIRRSEPGQCCSQFAASACRFGRTFPSCGVDRPLYSECPYSAARNFTYPVYEGESQ